MKRYLIAALLVVVLLAYWAWPFVSLSRLAGSLEARDEAAIAEEVDFTRLRSSLVSQIITAYASIVGQKSASGVFALAGANLIEIALLQILTPQSLADLLEGGTISTEMGPVSLDVGALPGTWFDSIWRGWLGTEYWMVYFSIGLPVSAPKSEQSRLQMELMAWQWKVVGLEVPQKQLMPIAQELAKKFPG